MNQAKYFEDTNQEQLFERTDFKRIEELSGLSKKEIKEVNKYLLSPKENPIELLNTLVKDTAKEVVKNHKNAETLLWKILTTSLWKDKKKNCIECHKINKIIEVLDSEKIDVPEKIQKVSKHSKKADFNEINILSNEYILRNEIVTLVLTHKQDNELIAKLYKDYFTNFIWEIKK